MTKLIKYWIIILAGLILVCSYPIYMGFSVIYDMATIGTVYKENFPKYIIPYTPIAIAVIAAVILMPLLFKWAEKFAILPASFFSLGVFFVTEWLFESKVIVTSTTKITLESWQMFMCYMPPDGYETRTWKAVDVLMGEYSPTFKLHFYLISVVLIIVILNCLYGFGQVIQTGDKKRLKALIVQSVCTVFFLGLCIFACFTAFFRDGEITVSALSAFLMGLFFIVLGVTAGLYIGSFLLGKKSYLSVFVPSVIASLITLAMYIGEMFLLSGHLYRFGSGIVFDGLPVIVLAPIDILIIVFAGLVSAKICQLLNNQ
ncbi:MAG: hypothetical protein E7266_02165 [Lachnospiraceae bacterium]|nr:hypothetical protein [Lachnospiraceae bacterium]